jgi:hypothetical protein
MSPTKHKQNLPIVDYSVVIDAEFDRKKHDLISCNCNRESVETT